MEAQTETKQKPRRHHWLTLAMERVRKTDEFDRSIGHAGIQDVPVPELLATIDAAIDAAIALAASGDSEQARQCAEEACAMAMMVKID